MAHIQLLDTTLRDGMNVTDFVIDDNIKSPIIGELADSGVDIIEVGFLREGEQKKNSAVYESVEYISQFIIPKRKGVKYAAICSLFDGAAPSHICERSTTTIDIIRVASFKTGMNNTLKLVAELKRKGYEVMLQPSRTSDYIETELIELIQNVNELQLSGIALVDSFGNMYPKKIQQMAQIYETHLAPTIKLCYHFHNNTQLAFANAIAVLDNVESNRGIILDASIFGMGCGAGNLPTELAMQYLNERYGCGYDYKKILDLYETYFLQIFKETPWGYQPRNYLTAKYNVHPYYGVYLETEYGLKSRELEIEFSKMPEDSKVNFVRKRADEIGRRLLNSLE